MIDDKKLQNKYRGLVSQVYESRKGDIFISATSIATEVMHMLDPNKLILDPNNPNSYEIYELAHYQLRQIARGFLRKKFESDDDESEQHPLFPDLQLHYPMAHTKNTDPKYVRLEHVTDNDVTYNLNRLRSEANAKLRHADALESWWRKKNMKRCS